MDRAKFLKCSSFLAYTLIVFFLIVMVPLYINIILDWTKVSAIFSIDTPEYINKGLSGDNLLIARFIENYVGTLVISLFFIIYNLIYLRKNKNTWLASFFPFCFKELKTSNTFAYKMKPGSYWTLYTFIILFILALMGFQLFTIIAVDYRLIIPMMINIIFLIVTSWSLFSLIVIITTSDYKTVKLNKSTFIEMKTDIEIKTESNCSVNAGINK
ncbi:hypothetical protein LNO71_01020 [Mycoplasma sp. T264T]|uniref:Uncharacterized protein n=2 Tax=Mycoplasma bradburyae TaxID=2963128 RepID=A0AAW6HRK1_9MOLU|nr:hypothetical protein [Mycoplasma bradburyae]